MDRFFTTQTQKFWHGGRKGKGFCASLVMLQERSQVAQFMEQCIQKKSLDVSFLTAPKLRSRYCCHFTVSFVIQWVTDSARTSFYR